MEKENDSPPGGISRRDFIKFGGATASSSLACALAPRLAGAASTGERREGYPVKDVTALSTIKVDTPIPFTYPDDYSPALLVRLPHAAAGGVGPDNSIVAYSLLCTHKGCPVSYRPERKLLICPCHWSSFDPAKSGQMVIGQASEALPQIALRINGSIVQAVGVEGLIYGRHTNIL